MVQSIISRGRPIGQGTPFVAPEQAKGSAGVPLNTPQRAVTPSRSRSAEKSDGTDSSTPPIQQPTPVVVALVEVPVASPPIRASLSERETTRESPHSDEGLRLVVIRGGEQLTSLTQTERRAFFDPLRRVFSALREKIQPQPPNYKERDLYRMAIEEDPCHNPIRVNMVTRCMTRTNCPIFFMSCNFSLYGTNVGQDYFFKSLFFQDQFVETLLHIEKNQGLPHYMINFDQFA